MNVTKQVRNCATCLKIRLRRAAVEVIDTEIGRFIVGQIRIKHKLAIHSTHRNWKPIIMHGAILKYNAHIK